MNSDGLIYAFILDGSGGGRQLDWQGIRSWHPEQGPIWIHLDYSVDQSRDWIQKDSNIDKIAAEALLNEETRPRATAINDAILLSLRGVNLNPGSDPEDMVSIRMWLNTHQVVTTRKRILLSAADMAASLQNGNGPKTIGGFLVDFAGRITSRMETVVEEMEDRSAQLEEAVIDSGNSILRSELSAIRRETIMLRRYLAPQREAMIKLTSATASWLADNDRMRLREVTDQLVRYIEDLDSIRDRASVTQEELVNRLSEQMNSRMYVLSLVAALFLPLGFFTGLLGINVGGIPGSDNPWAFAIFIAILLVIVTFQVIYFKKKQWM
ncbi:MAG: zinc transporter ZntB [Zetaproteobacteria bacterium CG12_big_fil_rev_8_21_14_0_65_54_13]|nr:MAG: zinc transporter ZntB [Zetaproteobacteria bacterium CG12_big_fil_rev_8_21_14_0_65_54_13]PIX55930.1 MAG: zinc transporter ZntB [Zetaproteobacteria bacterium CG_4_10_14_3_um_filter_54_28]